jgi:hypothetical protein
MKEAPLLKRILLNCSRGTSRLFRMNVGTGWIGESKRFTKPTTILAQKGDVLIRNARPFRAGIEGMHDLIGWQSVVVTPEMVGMKLAVFTSLEVKGAGGRPRAMQLVFKDNVIYAGGLSGIVYSVEEAEKVLSIAERC